MSGAIADIREAAVPPVLDPAPAGTGYVCRFANLNNGGYFYTGSEAEKNATIRDYPNMRFEGSSVTILGSQALTIAAKPGIEQSAISSG